MKADQLSLRLRRRHQLSNRIEYYLKLAIVLLLQFLQLPRHFSVGSKHLSQANERAHNLDARSHRAFAVEHVRCHDRTMFRESIRQIASAAV